MHFVYIGVGSNLGDRQNYISRAEQMIRLIPDVCFLKSAPVYETDPVGPAAGPPQGKFLNTVWCVRTILSPQALLLTLQSIEYQLGREREFLNGPRTIDLDILFFDDLAINETELTIPHPRIESRWFVLKPMADLDACFIHPVCKKSIGELLDECHASHSVS